MNNIFQGFEAFVNAEPITKGLTKDKKYCVTAADGTRMLLRISDISELERKKAEYDMMERVYELGALTSQPLGFGLCDDGKSCYSLSEWLDGVDAEKALLLMSETEQYILGLKAGETLRKIHTLPASDDACDWSIRFERKVQNWIDKYKSKPEVHSDIAETFLRYLKEHRACLASRPKTFIHGDYNSENIIVMSDGSIRVIDFNCYNSTDGDPWWDINNMAWMPNMYPHFYTGQINGYFNGEPPVKFWDVLTYYLAYDALAALTDPYGLNGIEDGTEIVNKILKWTEGFQNPVPAWYLKNHPSDIIQAPPQSWAACGDALHQYIVKLVELFQNILNDNLVGVYLHGSLAMGSYFPPKSDIDILVVATESLSTDLSKKLNIEIAKYSEKRPTIGNIECSVITLETAENVPDEMPYELHFSEAWYQRIIDNQVEYGIRQIDPDLPAHLMTVKKRGVCLYGKNIDEVFGDVNWQNFMAAVLDDFNWIVEDENICESPYYCILNICRVLQALTENNQKNISKYEGAVWGLKNLPCDYTPIIRKALIVYSSNTIIEDNQRKTGGVEWDNSALIAFRDYARNEKDRLMADYI